MAAHAERERFALRIADLHVMQRTIDDFRKQLWDKEPRVIGISMMTAIVIAAKGVARCVKDRHPDAKIVFCGVRVEVMPCECHRNRAIDIVVHRGGEQTFRRVLTGAAVGCRDGVVDRMSVPPKRTPDSCGICASGSLRLFRYLHGEAASRPLSHGPRASPLEAGPRHAPTRRFRCNGPLVTVATRGCAGGPNRRCANCPT